MKNYDIAYFEICWAVIHKCWPIPTSISHIAKFWYHTIDRASQHFLRLLQEEDRLSTAAPSICEAVWRCDVSIRGQGWSESEKKRVIWYMGRSWEKCFVCILFLKTFWNLRNIQRNDGCSTSMARVGIWGSLQPAESLVPHVTFCLERFLVRYHHMGVFQ